MTQWLLDHRLGSPPCWNALLSLCWLIGGLGALPCFDQARYPSPEGRFNVTIDGVSQALRFGTASWDTSKLISQAFKIVLEEWMGINAVQWATCSSSVSCIYLVAGCADPEQQGNPRCEDARQPTIHTLIGPWMHQATRGALQDLESHHPNMYPLSMGSVGYDGADGIFGPSSSLGQALREEHLSLDYYMSYSHPRVRPFPYFDSLWNISLSELRPCNATLMLSDEETIQTYLTVTGDVGGTTTIMDAASGVQKTVGRCDDGYWWIAPACRQNVSTCVPFITGGYGWSLDSMMQRAALWSVPIAAAVAKDWTSYSAIPLRHRTLIGWWAPDSTFLALDPFEITWPRHVESQWGRGNVSTANTRVYISKWAFPDAQNMSNSNMSKVLKLLELFTFTREDIDMLLRRQLQSGGGDVNSVACDFLLETNIWTKWIPKETACKLGQGLIAEDGAFVENRTASAVGCKWCLPGFKSVPLQDYAGLTHVCEPCSPGQYQPGVGQQACELCAPGEVAPNEGMLSCERCTIGRYADGKGHTACSFCPPGFVTELLGATDQDSCLCAAGSCRHAINRTACSACAVGMVCNTGCDELGFRDVDKEAYAPYLAPGFWSSIDQPFSVFRCESTSRCPGQRRPGPNSACPKTSIDSQVCSVCPEGKVWEEGECVTCESIFMSSIFFPVLPVLVFPLLIIGLYRASRDSYDRWGTWQNGLASTFFIVLLHFHVVNLLNQADITPSDTVKATLDNFAVASDVLALFKLKCNGYTSFDSYMILQTLSPGFVIGMYVAVWGVSQLVGRRYSHVAMDHDLAMNGCFSLIFTFFIGIASAGFTLFRCSANPNGKFTLLEDRGITCYEERWRDMLVCGIFAIMFWCIGFGLLVAWAIWTAPAKFHHEYIQRRWKFLFIRYRPDVHWWSLVLIVKGILLSLGAVFMPSGTGQITWIMICLIAYTSLEFTFRPWRHISNTALDGLVHMSLKVVCLCMASFSWKTASADAGPLADTVIPVLIYGALLPGLPAAVYMLYTQRSKYAQEQKEKKVGLILDSMLACMEVEEEKRENFLMRLPEADFLIMSAFNALVQTELCGRRLRGGYANRELMSVSSADLASVASKASLNFKSRSLSISTSISSARLEAVRSESAWTLGSVDQSKKVDPNILDNTRLEPSLEIGMGAVRKAVL